MGTGSFLYPRWPGGGGWSICSLLSPGLVDLPSILKGGGGGRGGLPVLECDEWLSFTMLHVDVPCSMILVFYFLFSCNFISSAIQNLLTSQLHLWQYTEKKERGTLLSKKMMYFPAEAEFLDEI
jgi:hypothetical protein